MAKKGRKPIASIAVALIRSANDAVGLDIHSVNVAEHRQIGNEASASTAAQSSNLQGVRASSYAQTECKEASRAVHSGRTINVKKTARRTRSLSGNISTGHRGDQRKQRGDTL